MKLHLGPIQHWERYEDDALAHDHADLLDESGIKQGQVNQHFYRPQWTYGFSHFRGRQPNFEGPFGGAAYDTAEAALAAAQEALDAWFAKQGESK